MEEQRKRAKWFQKIHRMDLWVSFLCMFLHIDGLWYSAVVIMMMILRSKAANHYKCMEAHWICAQFALFAFDIYLTDAFLWHLESLPRFIATHSELWDFEQQINMPNLEFSHFFPLNGRERKKWVKKRRKKCVTVLALLRRCSSRNTESCCCRWVERGYSIVVLYLKTFFM